MEDVYQRLRALKRANESFSEALRRELGQRGDIMELAGAWSEVSDEEIEEMKEQIREVSRSSTKSLLKRFGGK